MNGTVDFFNFVNQKGIMRFLDGQTGTGGGPLKILQVQNYKDKLNGYF